MRTRGFFLAAGLVSGAASFVTMLPSCSSSSSTPADDGGADAADPRPPTPAAWDQPVTRPDDATAASSRAACKFVRGDMPAATLGTSTPVDSDIPIQHVVVLMQENRSFDSYFGHLNAFAHRTDIESAPDSASNPDAPGGAAGSHPWMHAPHLCFLDTDHSWKGAHAEYDDGKNDGFYAVNNDATNPADDAGAPADSRSDGERSMWWYDETDLPFYYQLASTFAIGDHYFSSILGPTWPNRMYLFAATSFGMTSNGFPDLTAYTFPGNDAVVLDELEERHVDWFLYADGAPGAGVTLGIGLGTRYEGRDPLKSIAEFMTAASSGTLPGVSFVDGKLGDFEGPVDDDEHPPSQIQIGEQFVESVVNAIMTGPEWATTALFITYDENGGIYDHLPPAAACAPDAIAPKTFGGDVGTAGDFARYGFRVPVIVVSPYAKKAFVSHAVYDHASITRFIETKFKLPALTARDANADPFSDVFDWQSPPFMTPPTFDPAPVNQDEVTYCKKNFTQ